ncbi:PREDICTED: LOW QUALITY PROTEIN: atherin-like [Dipodomys ordii]|uniref:LOW QUALITY PROTEIN: atherin-like n=1 Tax=Dipodomys ordii TaxID=10020 RepID=A0A1S3FU22_DIPOR|nr:PREDICTED: LOW QUALITY PROTEIN: atherin-like [Dipodomys ordii]
MRLNSNYLKDRNENSTTKQPAAHLFSLNNKEHWKLFGNYNNIDVPRHDYKVRVYIEPITQMVMGLANFIKYMEGVIMKTFDQPCVETFLCQVNPREKNQKPTGGKAKQLSQASPPEQAPCPGPGAGEAAGPPTAHHCPGGRSPGPAPGVASPRPAPHQLRALGLRGCRRRPPGPGPISSLPRELKPPAAPCRSLRPSSANPTDRAAGLLPRGREWRAGSRTRGPPRGRDAAHPAAGLCGQPGKLWPWSMRTGKEGSPRPHPGPSPRHRATRAGSASRRARGHLRSSNSRAGRDLETRETGGRGRLPGAGRGGSGPGEDAGSQRPRAWAVNFHEPRPDRGLALGQRPGVCVLLNPRLRRLLPSLDGGARLSNSKTQLQLLAIPASGKNTLP